jgi:hypothetical protein
MTYEDPVTKKGEREIDGETTTHPCFAQIGASRVSGSTYLYGSGFNHHHYVTISIMTSELNRNLSRDWHHGRKELIEVAMSESQWATFVSSMNQGSGIPCTLTHLDRKMVPQLPDSPKLKAQFDSELRERLGIVEDSLTELAKLIQGTKLSQKQKDILLSELGTAERNLTPNLKFVAKQFSEHMEGEIDKAKVEIEAHLNSALQRAGVEHLNEKKPIELMEGK